MSAAVPVPRGIAERFAGLALDEQRILESLLARLEAGRDTYGPWNVRDGRDYPAEAYEEIIDGLHYCAAELVRRRHLAQGRRRRVYVCHPFANDPAANCVRVRAICRGLVVAGALPIAPHLYLPAFLDEASEREIALALCLELVDVCDEVRVYGAVITPGMSREIAHARQRGVPVRFVEAVS